MSHSNNSHNNDSVLHRSVLLRETVDLLAVQRGGVFIDATLGLGGHSEAILDSSSTARVIGIDRDRTALDLATQRLADRFGKRFQAVHANFRDIRRVVEEAGESVVSGVAADLGVSSLQLDTAERGFSFRYDAPLDMRMDRDSDGETVTELLARLPEEEIARIIFEYGEERRSRRIARSIVRLRDQGHVVKTTGELAELVGRSIGHRGTDRIHPATRTFQALRIAVNDELDGLAEFVVTAVDLLEPGGRFAVISFHSLEDRIMKRTLRRLAGQCTCEPNVLLCSCRAPKKEAATVEILTKRPIIPSEPERNENPRARSAKLRGCLKLGSR